LLLFSVQVVNIFIERTVFTFHHSSEAFIGLIQDYGGF